MSKNSYIPQPTGSYSVGSSLFTIIDENRVESIGPNAGKENRKLTFRVYYPALVDDTANLEKGTLLTRQVTTAMGKEFFIKKDYDKLCANGENDAPCYENAPHIPEQKFPLVFYSHGYKSYIEGNTFLCCELASQGYVVISIGHPYEAMALTHTDGTECYFDASIMKRSISPFLPGFLATAKLQNKTGEPEKLYNDFLAVQNKYCQGMVSRLEEWVSDTIFVYENAKKSFSDFIDFSRGVAATGHSMGGATAYALCQKHPDFTCGLNIDGGLFGDYEGMTMTKPFFQICSSPNYSVETKAMLNKTAPAYFTTFKQIKHIAFADVKFFIKIAAVTGKIPEKLTHETLCKCHVDFLDKYMKNKEIKIKIPENEYIRFEVF